VSALRSFSFRPLILPPCSTLPHRRRRPLGGTDRPFLPCRQQLDCFGEEYARRRMVGRSGCP
jgi:hypothetical protein